MEEIFNKKGSYQLVNISNNRLVFNELLDKIGIKEFKIVVENEEVYRDEISSYILLDDIAVYGKLAKIYVLNNDLWFYVQTICLPKKVDVSRDRVQDYERYFYNELEGIF